MSPPDTAAVMLLIMHLVALGVACIIFGVMLYLHRRHLRNLPTESLPETVKGSDSNLRPASWLAIRSAASETVRRALPDQNIFSVSAYTNGWVVVSGTGLPCPGDDVDECFRFLLGLSRKFGHVQFFYAERFSLHHAWARLDEGCVTRAYAWTGETVWQQGAPTLAERELGLKCFDYGDETGTGLWSAGEMATANVEKIPRLAARWSLDPATLPRGGSLTGESNRLY